MLKNKIYPFNNLTIYTLHGVFLCIVIANAVKQSLRTGTASYLAVMYDGLKAMHKTLPREV